MASMSFLGWSFEFDRRCRRPGPRRSGRGALDAGVHVGLVVVADVEDVVIALGRGAERLDPDVERSAVAGPGDDLGLGVADHFQAGLDAGGRRGGGLERAVINGDAQTGIGERPVDDGPAAGRNADGRPLAEGLEDVSEGEVGPAPLAGEIARTDELLRRESQRHLFLFAHFLTPIQLISSAGLSCRRTMSTISRKDAALMSRPPSPAMKPKTGAEEPDPFRADLTSWQKMP